MLDSRDQPLYVQRYPRRVYAIFDDIPKVLVNSLQFIENHDLLNPEYPERNPAIDWRRFTRASFDQALHLINKNNPSPGGSTLATQIEKYRHSPAGRTVSPTEKLRQMASASVRAYLGGKNTLAWRREIVLDYLNTVPLSANTGHGEVEGIGDGLWAWFGEDFNAANRLLDGLDHDGAISLRQAAVFKEALSLMIAQRRPSYYLRENTAALDALTDSYARLMASAGVIPVALRDATLAIRLRETVSRTPREDVPFVDRKAINGVRAELAELLGMDTLYDLDRLDVRVATTIDQPAQQAISDVLMRVRTRDGARAAGLYGYNMLRDSDDPGQLTFSFTLYELWRDASLLRVQADSVDQPFDINRGARLNLGSTAKLRTLISYLEIIADLHQRFAGQAPAELRRLTPPQQDALSRWAVDYLARNPGAELAAMLDAAMERKYSANPGEGFATGGGVQHFENFERWENSQIMTVRAAFQNSVNLVFIRLMRDIVRYEIYQIEPAVDQWISDPESPQRRAYLVKFADREGSVFLQRFYKNYRDKPVDQALDAMFENKRPSQVQLAVALRSADPTMNEVRFMQEMRNRLPDSPLDNDTLRKLYSKYGVDKFSLNDRGYLARVHPLALWLVNYLRQQPDASLAQVLKDSASARQEVYAWLFKTRYAGAQANRIRDLLEIAAFQRIALRWQRLGYPFGALTPSYATAIGASGDRPAALAKLVGMILSDGTPKPIESVRNLEFASGTPYATGFVAHPTPAEPLLSPAITAVVRRSLFDVVDGGTAKSLRGTFGEAGGKTGTGVQLYQVYGSGARVIASDTVNRSGTFVFIICKRYFGTVTAYVHEPYAARYRFTSALAVQFLKSVAPIVNGLTERGSPACMPAGRNRVWGQDEAQVTD